MTTTNLARTTDQTAPAEQAPARPRRAVNVSLWALQVLTAAIFVWAAIPKLTADPMAVQGFTAMSLGIAGMYIIGSLEVAGAVALLIPRLAGLAGLAFVGLMIGAVIASLPFGAAMVVVPAAVGVLAAVIAWGRRRSTVELVARARGRQAGTVDS